MTDVKRDTITVSTIITVLFMLKKKKAEAAEAEKAGELKTAAGVPTAVALEEGSGYGGARVIDGAGAINFNQQDAIFVRYPGYKVFFAPTTGTLQKQDDNIILTHY